MTADDPHAQKPPPPPKGFDPISEEAPSPMAETLGVTLTRWKDGFAEVACPVSPRVINRQGVVHGGALAMLLDTASGYAVVWCPYPGRKRNAFTLSLDTQFIAAARTGSLTAEARIVGGGASVCFTDAAVYDQDRRLIAKATGVFKRRSGSVSPWGEPRGA